jgi:hypothetical protein
VAPPDPRGPWCEQFWIYIISESFPVNMTDYGSVVLEKKIFKWTHPIFAIISPLKRTWPFIYTNKNSFYPRMIYAKFDWNWPAGSGEEDSKKIFSVFLLFCDYLPLEKGNPLHLYNLESPPPKNDLCQVWLKLAQWFWRRSQKCKSLQTDGQMDDGRSE